MGKRPLQDPRLFDIEVKLNEARLEDAQRLLAELPAIPGAESASVYFATRLLFQRGRLDHAGVIERLRELLRTTSDFPEAERMLHAAESGVLEASPESARRSTCPPESVVTERVNPQRASLPSVPDLQEIPRAPPLPRITPDLESLTLEPASYASAPRGFSEPAPSARYADTELSPPPPAPSEASFLDRTIPSPPPVATSRHDSLPPVEDAPSLFAVAGALDRGDTVLALALAEKAAPSPEMTLLKARILAAQGDRSATEFELAKLLRAPLLDPGLRSGTARLLLDLGSPERAVEQARRALEDDPDDPIARVTCAWALLRQQSASSDRRVCEEAEQLLPNARLSDPTLSALIPALRARISLGYGDAARAMLLAKTALSHDPHQPDALAAMTLASAELGLQSDAERGMRRLYELWPEIARGLSSQLGGPAAPLDKAPPAPAASEASVAAVFGEAEAAVARGRSELAIVGFERACNDRLRALSRRGGTEGWSQLSAAAARLFTELPVLRHFAPYDSSIFSIDRLAAALNVLYDPSVENAFGDEGIVLLVGAYFGESLRRAFGGEWNGSPDRPMNACVEAIGLSIYPCERVSQSLHARELLASEQPAHLHPGADPFGSSQPLSLSPPCPWDPEPWPTTRRVAEIGRLLPDSIIGVYCARQGHGRLDYSVAGLSAIDQYVGLLSPLKAAPSPDASWVRRASIMVGAYLGEVLVCAAGARWLEEEHVDSPAAYRLSLRDGSLASPIARVSDRFSGRRVSPLSEYVARLTTAKTTLNL